MMKDNNGRIIRNDDVSGGMNGDCATSVDGKRWMMHHNPWHRYVQWVQDPQHREMLEWADDVLSRLVWWFPPSSSQHHKSQWRRQVLWGLLELHRLGMDLALASNPYATGTTISLPNDYDGRVVDDRIRILLTVLQCLGPVVMQQQEVWAPSHVHHDDDGRRPAMIRYRVEQCRLLLRATLLVRYWSKLPRSMVGLQQVGGGLGLAANTSSTTYEEAVAQQVRHTYVGRRTGRRCIVGNNNNNSNNNNHSPVQRSPSADDNAPTYTRAKLVVGEVLYILRPLFLAWVEQQQVHQQQYTSTTARNNNSSNGRLWQAWCVSLGMDVASLGLLRFSTMVHDKNAAGGGGGGGGHDIPTHQEWKRRRMRLLLYLLRSPAWEERTGPVVNRVDGILSKVPLLGRLVAAYLQDWLRYWQVYRCEEG